jgi:hypothetical protein
MKRRALCWSIGLTLACSLGACKREAAGPVSEAKFGVFFGGQVQELKEIAKELDPARQKHGIRLTFRAPLEHAASVAWELLLPASEKQSGPRAALVGQASAKAGETELDVPLAFRPTDPLGSWHVKVSVDGQPVIDRDFTVVAPPPAPKAAGKPLTPRIPGSAGGAPP